MSNATPAQRIGERLRGHLRANVVAYLALFVALGGTGAWAAEKITSRDIAKNAVRAKHIKKNAVRTPEIEKRAVTRAKLAAPTLFGNFDGSDGSLARGRGIASSERGGTGFYIIRFDRNIRRCALLAGPSSTNSTNSSSRTVGAAYYIANSRKDEAFVLIRNDFADSRDDADFSLAAFC
jgi:hypothetical protein